MILTNDEHIEDSDTDIIDDEKQPDKEMEDWNLDNDKDEE